MQNRRKLLSPKERETGIEPRDVQGRKTIVFHRVSRPERPECQLGNMRVVCLSKTSRFNTFIQVYGVAPKLAKWPVFVP